MQSKLILISERFGSMSCECKRNFSLLSHLHFSSEHKSTYAGVPPVNTLHFTESEIQVVFVLSFLIFPSEGAEAVSQYTDNALV